MSFLKNVTRSIDNYIDLISLFNYSSTFSKMLNEICLKSLWSLFYTEENSLCPSGHISIAVDIAYIRYHRVEIELISYDE